MERYENTKPIVSDQVEIVFGDNLNLAAKRESRDMCLLNVPERQRDTFCPLYFDLGLFILQIESACQHMWL